MGKPYYNNNYGGGYRNHNYHHNYHHNNNRQQPRTQTIYVAPPAQPAQDPWKGLGARIIEGTAISAISTLISGLCNTAASAYSAKTTERIAELEAQKPVQPDYRQGPDGKYYDSYGNMIVPREQINQMNN